MLSCLYQIFIFLLGHFHFFLPIFFTFMENLFKKHPISSYFLSFWPLYPRLHLHLLSTSVLYSPVFLFPTPLLPLNFASQSRSPLLLLVLLSTPVLLQKTSLHIGLKWGHSEKKIAAQVKNEVLKFGFLPLPPIKYVFGEVHMAIDGTQWMNGTPLEPHDRRRVKKGAKQGIFGRIFNF